MWAAEQAPDYAPELQIVGVAAGGIPTDFAHNLDYIAAAPTGPERSPRLGSAWRGPTGSTSARFLSESGKRIATEVFEGCLEPAAFPGLKFEDLLKPKYQNFRQIPEFAPRPSTTRSWAARGLRTCRC